MTERIYKGDRPVSRNADSVVIALRNVAYVLEKADQRVGQFIYNACSVAGIADPFYVENDVLVDAIYKYAESLKAQLRNAV